jgi:hypothetical protein
MASSGGGFQVDPQSLNTLAQTLLNIGSELNTIHDQRGNLGSAISGNNLGSSDGFPSQPFNTAGGALTDFAGDWSNGIAQLNKEASDLATALQAAATSYSQTEQQLTSAITPSSQTA